MEQITNIKVCVNCHQSLDIDNFYIIKKTQQYSNRCIGCKKKYDVKYRASNKDKASIYNAKYRNDNKKIISKKRKQKYQDDTSYRENIKNYQSEYRNINSDKINIYQNIPEVKKKRYTLIKKWRNNKRKSDTAFKLRESISTQINQALVENNSSKLGQSCKIYLNAIVSGDYFDCLKLHLEQMFEPWMNWSNRGKYNKKSWNDNDQSTWTWNIDHIIPQSILPYTTMEEENFRLCWSLSNLRPYNAKQNIIDGVSRTRHTKDKEMI